jgi:prepilin-type N-terminal cleavage/methylation domain-containing protein
MLRTTLSQGLQRNVQTVGSQRGRLGFTIVELLVTIAVIGCLMAMLMPAVQGAREAARRVQCADNLRQLGLAAANFHSAQCSFPPGHQVDSTTGATWGHLAYLLPFLDKNVVFQKLDFTKPSTDPANALLPTVALPVLRCPSDIDRLDSSTDPQALLGWAKNNYRGNAGNDTGALDSNGNEKNNGVFLTNRRTNLDQITDGLGATTLFSEGLLGDGDNNVISNPGDWFAIAPATNGRSDVYAALLAVTPAVGPSNQLSCAGTTFVFGNYTDSRYNHIMPPNGPSGVVANGGDLFTAVNSAAQATTASSRHPAGVNVVLASGCVRFIKNDIDIQTWWALGSIAGGETPCGDF